MNSSFPTSGHILLGDIGGTNCRLGIWDRAERVFTDRMQCTTDDFLSPGDAIASFLGSSTARPHLASLALACPITGDRPRLTNTSWSFDRSDLIQRFSWDNLVLVNDLVAQARAVRLLDPESLVFIGPHRSYTLSMPSVIIGPGTGLGVALLQENSVTPSEGGHSGFAASDDVEANFVKAWRSELGRVSNEHALSGPGIRRLYQELALAAGAEPLPIDGPEIVRRGNANECSICIETCERFAKMLGSVASDFALTFCSASVVLVGSIASSLLPFLVRGGFRSRFEQPGPGRSYLTAVPTAVATARDLGLHGARTFLDDLNSVSGTRREARRD